MEQEQSIDTDKLSYEIFSILESKFLFGLEDRNLWPDLSAAAPPSDGGVTAVKYQRGKICVLSIDAGGMRSILPGKALAYLETAIRKKSGDQTANIADYFDLAAGAGVGGIFTAMLFGTKDHSRPIFQADDTWQFLATHGKKFYRNKKPNRFSCTGLGTKAGSISLERALREAFTDENGRCLTLKDTLKPVLIPCYDLATSAPFVFSRADALEADGFDFRLWEACCATAAAPAAALGSVEVASADGRTRCVAVGGGLGVSNPAAVAVTHVLHNKQEFPFVRGVEDILVLSLGTGQALDASYRYEQAKRWKAKDWARPMARISGDGSADFVDHAVAMAFGQSRSSNYVRIQANGSSLGHCSPNVDFDPSSSNVKMLMGIADEMLKQKNVESVLFGGKRIGEESNYEKLDWFAGELVLEHQRRSCRIAPTVAFKQATPKPI